MISKRIPRIASLQTFDKTKEINENLVDRSPFQRLDVAKVLRLENYACILNVLAASKIATLQSPVRVTLGKG